MNVPAWVCECAWVYKEAGGGSIVVICKKDQQYLLNDQDISDHSYIT